MDEDTVIISTPHLDASETTLTARSLETIRAKTYDIKFPQLKGRTFVPLDNTLNPATETVTYRQYTPTGMAVMIASYSQRLPRADVFSKEFTSRVRGLGTSYGYSVHEMKVAAFTGNTLEQRKANAARQAYEQKTDLLIQTGDAAFGLLGFLNQPNVGIYTVPNGAGSSPLWVNKTPDEILADMNGIVNAIVSTTLEVEAPDTLILPLAQYTLISTKARSSTSDTTILEFFLKNSPYIKEVRSWAPLKTAGASATTRMVAYRNDPDALQYIEPEAFNQMAPVMEGMEMVTYCTGRSGGVVFYYPLSALYGDGI